MTTEAVEDTDPRVVEAVAMWLDPPMDPLAIAKQEEMFAELDAGYLAICQSHNEHLARLTDDPVLAQAVRDDLTEARGQRTSTPEEAYAQSVRRGVMKRLFRLGKIHVIIVQCLLPLRGDPSFASLWSDFWSTLLSGMSEKSFPLLRDIIDDECADHPEVQFRSQVELYRRTRESEDLVRARAFDEALRSHEDRETCQLEAFERRLWIWTEGRDPDDLLRARGMAVETSSAVLMARMLVRLASSTKLEDDFMVAIDAVRSVANSVEGMKVLEQLLGDIASAATPHDQSPEGKPAELDAAALGRLTELVTTIHPACAPEIARLGVEQRAMYTKMREYFANQDASP